MLNIVKRKSIRTIRLPIKERRALLYFKKEIAKQLGGRVKEIKLFGSKARGNWRKDSDIDILIILENSADKESAKDLIYDAVLAICEKYGVYLSVKVFKKLEFEYYASIPTLFARNVLRESVRL